MSGVSAALTPVFLLIVGGYAIKRGGFLPDAFWPSAEKLTFYLFFPALLFSNTARAALGDVPFQAVIAASIGGVVLIAAAVAFGRQSFGLAGARYTSVFQGAIRPNTYLGIAAAATLYGEPGLTLVSLCVAVGVPLVNLLSIVVLARHANEVPPRWFEMIAPVVRNPLILACVGGLAFNGTGVALPSVIASFLEVLGRAALPLGLLAVGAGLDFGALKAARRTVMATTAVKVLALPLITFGLCVVFGVDGIARAVVVLYASLPVSATSYVLARQMGGDGPLLAGVITATTIAAAVTMPLVLMVVAPVP